MTTAVFPGSFDPVTLGHVDIALRARTLFDTVVIVVAHNSSKRPLLDVETRVELARQAVSHLEGVEVDSTEGLISEYCRHRGASVIVKGLRGGADFDNELPMALMNRSLTGVETVFVAGDSSLQHIASSLVRDVAAHGGTIKHLVPPDVEPAVLEALNDR